MSPTSLVTGGAGFIGSHVAAELANQGHRVIVLDDLSSGSAANLPAGADLVQGSICDQSLVNDLFARHGFDYVFHLAAYAAVGLSHFVRRFNYLNNVIGSVNLINAAVNAQTVSCFVFASSTSVYGAGVDLTEEAPTLPCDPYGVAKLAIEHDLRVSREVFGLPYIIFRPHNVYGERQDLGDLSRNVVGIFVNHALNNEPMPIFGTGEQTREFTYIGDVAPLIAASVKVPAAYGQTFNIGSDERHCVLRLAELVAHAVGVPPRFRHLPARTEVEHVGAAHEKLRRVFGPVDSTPLETGLARMVGWARRDGPRRAVTLPPIEVSRSLPPSWRALVSRNPVPLG